MESHEVWQPKPSKVDSSPQVEAEASNLDSEWNQAEEAAEKAEREDRTRELHRQAVFMLLCVSNGKVAAARSKALTPLLAAAAPAPPVAPLFPLQARRARGC